MSLFAQDLPTVIPPSPSVSNLMHFEEVPVSHYTGQPDIALPLYTKTVNSNFSLPVNLMYNTMGVRVDERSGWAGTGWSITGEAVISRTVRDIADELDQVNIHTTSSTNKVIGVYHNGYYDLSWSPTGNYEDDAANCNIQDFLWNASGKGSGSFDGDYDNEPDLYQLSLYGATARFVIVKEGTSLVVKMMENDSNLQITLIHNANYEINKFTVLDTKGIEYIFNTTDAETSSSSSYSVSIKQNGDPANISMPSDMQYTSAWKISTVNTVNGLNLATYTYQDITETFKTPTSESRTEIKHMTYATSAGISATWDNVVGSPYQQSLSWAIYNNSILKPKYTKSETTLTIQTKKVSSIDFYDQSRIEFLTSNTLNHPEFDTSAAKVLQKIIVKKPNGSDFKTFELAHSVTPNNRLFLDSVKETFSTNNFYNYHLAYTNKEELPEFGSPNKDIWGYYKAEESPGLPANCKLKFSADKDKVRTGVLEKITYPTSGVKNFIFESNRFSQLGAKAFTEDDFAQYNPDNYNCTTAWGDFDNSNIQNDLYSSYTVSFTNLRPQEVSVRTTSSSGTAVDKMNTSIRIVKIDPLNLNADEVIAQIKLDDVELFTLPAGDYEIRLFSLSPNSNSLVNVNAKINYKLFQNPLKHYLYGGGLRIKEIFFNEQNDLTPKTKTLFGYDVLGGKGGALPVDTPSSGVLDGLFSNIKEYTKSQKHTVALFNFGSTGNNTTTAAMHLDVDYKVVDKLSSIQASLTKGNYVGYGKVSVRNVKGDAKGSTLYHFTTPVDHPTYDENYGFPFLPLPDKSHLQGVLTKQEVFNATDQMLKEVTYLYHNPIELSVAKSLFVYDNECYDTQFYSTLDHYIASEPTPGRGFMGNSASYLHGNCITGSSTCEAPVYYTFYDVLFSKYLLKDKITKDYFYADAQATTGKEVATKQTLFYNPVYYQVSEDRTYMDINDETKYYKTRYHYPSPSTFPVGYNDENTAVSSLRDLNRINDVIATETFKDGVKLSQTNTIYDEQVTNLVLPSKVQVGKGAKTPETRLEYTKYDSYGNILEVKKTAGSSIAYIWGYNSMYPVAKLENTTYADIETLLGSGFTLGTNGLTTIQETTLRTELPNAQISTFIYDPYLGIISTTDPKDYTMTYEYDDFNRLKHVKDQDGNILSKNEYRYVNQN